MQTTWLVTIFALGYAAIIFEHVIKTNKSAIALLMAVGCWMAFFLTSPISSSLVLQDLISALNLHLAPIAQIIFFLLGAMTIVEVIDSHKGFKIITDNIRTTSKRKMLWLVAIVTFFLSSVLDNLTTTILMISLLRKIVPDAKERFLFCCLVVIAANSGGAWTPIGDVTTTMLWIEEAISSWGVMRAVFIPSILSLLVPLIYFTFQVKGRLHPIENKEKEEPGARLIFWLGCAGLIFVPILKAWTGLPPFMGVLISLAVLWLVTDVLHASYSQRHHLRVPHILTKIDVSGVLFFLGILLTIGALESAHLLSSLATWLGTYVATLPLLSTLIGLVSAVIDNIPLVAATLGMYPLEQFPVDHSLWHMIAYAAGTGGSILIIGSSSGVALMGMEKIEFVTYMKKVSIPALIGYLVGMGSYLLLF